MARCLASMIDLSCIDASLGRAGFGGAAGAGAGAGAERAARTLRTFASASAASSTSSRMSAEWPSRMEIASAMLESSLMWRASMNDCCAASTIVCAITASGHSTPMVTVPSPCQLAAAETTRRFSSMPSTTSSFTSSDGALPRSALTRSFSLPAGERCA